MTNELPLQPFTVKSALFTDTAARAANASTMSGPGVVGRASASGEASEALPGSAFAGSGPQAGGLRGPGGSGPRGPQLPPDDNGSFEFPEGLIGRVIQWTVGIGFLVLYTASERYPEVASLSIVALIGCFLLRLNRRERQIAAAPLVVSGVRLALRMATTLFRLPLLRAATTYSVNPAYPASQFRPQDYGITWVPLFLAICLFFMPKRTSVTMKIVLACSAVLLVTGLLPSEGYLYIFAMVQMLLFFGIGVGLLVDFLPKGGDAHTREAAWGART
jgi:hypothetical protein